MNVHELLASFESKRILVVGDLVIDIATHLERIKDDDTGKPTYRTILDERGKADRFSIGGAGLVVRNLLELGAKVDFITATGYGTGSLHAETFQHINLTKHAIKVAKPQTVKHRFWCGGEKVMQVDTVDNSPLEWVDETSLWVQWDMSVGLFSKSHDAIIVADYRHGLINEDTAHRIVKARNKDIPLYVSSQVAQSGSNHEWYVAPNVVIVMNKHEAEESGLSACDSFREAIVTDGDRGGWIYTPKGIENWGPAFVNAIDPCGAGDAFLAAYSLTHDLQFANTWAGLSVTVQGANPPTKQMLLGWHEKQNFEPFEMAFCG
jgi:bifunctional ADP-heptose synthase (sugar kinase/adenylyltransferase)